MRPWDARVRAAEEPSAHARHCPHWSAARIVAALASRWLRGGTERVPASTIGATPITYVQPRFTALPAGHAFLGSSEHDAGRHPCGMAPVMPKWPLGSSCAGHAITKRFPTCMCEPFFPSPPRTVKSHRALVAVVRLQLGSRSSAFSKGVESVFADYYSAVSFAVPSPCPSKPLPGASARSDNSCSSDASRIRPKWVMTAPRVL